MPAISLQKILPFFTRRHYRYIVDYGAGTLHNSRYLASKGFRVVSVDKPLVLTRFAGVKAKSKDLIVGATSDVAFQELQTSFDVIVCTFVLNLLNWETNRFLAHSFTEKTKAGGLIFIEVKERRSGKETNALTLLELDRLFLRHGMIRVKCFSGRHSLVAIYEKL